MDGRDFGGAIRRSWRLIVLLACVFGLVGIVMPSHSSAATGGYKSTAYVSPVAGKTLAGITEVVYAAEDPTVLAAAAKASHVPIKQAYKVFTVQAATHNILSKGNPTAAIAVQATLGTKKKAIDGANNFAKALTYYITIKAANDYNVELCQADNKVAALEASLSDVQDNISTEQASPGSLSPSDITPTPGSTDAPQTDCSHPNAANQDNSQDSYRTGAPTSAVLTATSSTPTTTTPFNAPLAGVSGSSGNQTTTPSGSGGSATAPDPSAGSGSGSGGSSNAKIANSAANGDPVLAALLAQQKTLGSSLAAALTNQANLEATGPPDTHFQVIMPAWSAQSSNKKSAISVANSRYVRPLIGALIGMAIAVGIVILVEMLDRSLRSASRTEYAFDYPVVAEIPLWPALRPGEEAKRTRLPKLDVVLEPFSPTAEAYRRLRTMTALAPLASELAALGYGNANANANGNGDAYANGNGNGHAKNGNANGNGNGHAKNGNGNGNGNGHAKNGNGNGNGNGHAKNGNANGNGNGHAKNGNGNGNGNGHAKNGNGNGNGNGHGDSYDTIQRIVGYRQVILVVSAGKEPTRASVVANLAAVYAEAGSQALVINVGELGWHRRHDPALPHLNGAPVVADDIMPRTSPSLVDGVSRLRLDRVLESRGQIMAYGPEILDSARELADVVIVDSPPLLASHDALALLPAVDAVLVVAEQGVTKSEDARKASDLLHRFGAPVLGVVLTNTRTKEVVAPIGALPASTGRKMMLPAGSVHPR
jgi:Mrp family chromosome partitioning ATPase